jgi:hypothetical protein
MSKSQGRLSVEKAGASPGKGGPHLGILPGVSVHPSPPSQPLSYELSWRCHILFAKKEKTCVGQYQFSLSQWYQQKSNMKLPGRLTDKKEVVPFLFLLLFLFLACLSPFELLQHWEVYKQNFITHSSGGWEVWDQGTDRIGWALTFWCFLLCPHRVEGVIVSLHLFYKELTPFLRVLPMINHLRPTS